MLIHSESTGVGGGIKGVQATPPLPPPPRSGQTNVIFYYVLFEISTNQWRYNLMYGADFIFYWAVYSYVGGLPIVSISLLGCTTTSGLSCRCQIQLCPPCNTVRSGHFCICNCVRGYAKTVRRTCMCERKWACQHWTWCSMNIHVFYDCSEHPTAEHFPCQLWHALSL